MYNKRELERAYMEMHGIKNSDGETPKYAWEIENDEVFARMMYDLYGIVENAE